MLGAVVEYIAEVEEVGLRNEMYVRKERGVKISDMKIGMVKQETYPNGEANSVSESSIFMIVYVASISIFLTKLAKDSVRCLKKVWF